MFSADSKPRVVFRFSGRLDGIPTDFLLNVVFVLTWPVDIRHAGLALATVISEGVNGFLLGFLLHRRLGSPGWGQIFRGVARALVSSAVMAGLLLVARPALAQFLHRVSAPDKVVQLGSVLGAIVLGILAYFATAALLRAPELGFVREALQRRRQVQVKPSPVTTE